MVNRRLGFSFFALAFLGAALPARLVAQDLAIGPGDVRIEAREDGGYDLYVHAKPGLSSILLTESTKDPEMKADNFAYRSSEYNDVNGNEKRMLNGKALPPASKLYSLISSTPRTDTAFGMAFRILIPPVLVYGYSWSRSGTVAVGKGTFINIRAFSKPYADYSGAFRDNPYQIAVSTRPLPPPVVPPQESRPAAVVAPPERQLPATPPPPDDRTSSKLAAAIASAPGESLDLVVCLDTTESMVPYIDDIKKNLGPILRERVSGFKRFRIGIVLFKDYWPDEYITRKFPFTTDISAVERIVKSVTVYGGGDIPEAEIEALYSAVTEFDWSADRRQVILVTDASPHPIPRGKILFDDVVREARARRIEADSIIEPAMLASPGPEGKEYEHEARRIASLEASGVSVRLLAFADASDPEATRNEITSIEKKLFGNLAPDPRLSVMGAATMATSDDAVALKAASVAGANYLVLSRTRALGRIGNAGTVTMSETVSRLLETATGKELERDVVWRAPPNRRPQRKWRPSSSTASGRSRPPRNGRARGLKVDRQRLSRDDR